jgi:preprotein translocase subunit YajC
LREPAHAPSPSAAPEEVIVFSIITLLAQSGGSGSSALGLLLPLVLMGGIFYFLLIRPQQRRQRAQRDLLGSLAIGDEVVTIGGIHGTIRELDDENATIEVAPGVQIRFLRGAIARKLVEEDQYDASEDEEADDQS